MSQHKIKTIHPNDPFREIVIVGQPYTGEDNPSEIWEGLLWYKPSLDLIRIYIDGEFRELGAEGLENGGTINGYLNILGEDSGLYVENDIYCGGLSIFDGDLQIINGYISADGIIVITFINSDNGNNLDTYQLGESYSPITSVDQSTGENFPCQGVVKTIKYSNDRASQIIQERPTSGFSRVFHRSATAYTWTLWKQILDSSMLNSANGIAALNSEGKILPSIITEDSTHRFVTDSEKTTWNNKIDSSQKGTANGVAELDDTGKVLSAQLPSYVDDVLEYTNTGVFPGTGETGKIYVALDSNRTYRWSGSEYIEISASLALGETSSTAYRGDRGKTAYDHSQVIVGNPHGTTKTDVGLENVNNTSDLDKPVSTATQTALDTKLNLSGGVLTGQVKLPELDNISLTSTGNPLQIGDVYENIVFDTTGMQARGNGVAKPLYLQPFGGDVYVGAYPAWNSGTLPVEYGTWTPTLAGQTTAGTYNYSTRWGVYMREGRRVYVSCRIQLTTPITAGSGNMMITGLPFTPMSGGFWCGTTVLAGPSGWTGNYVSAFIDGTSNFMRFYATNSSSGSGFILVTTAVNGNVINASIEYLIP